MRKLLVIPALILACLLAVVALITGCDRAKVTTTGEIPRELYRFSLTDMWNAVAKVTDIQAEDARLGTDQTEFINGNGNFAFDLYRQLEAGEGNFFFSPYSISNASTLYNNASSFINFPS